MVRDDLTLSHLSAAPFFYNSRTLLQTIHAAGGVKATVAGNLTRAFVASLCELFRFPPDYLEDHRQVSKVLNEEDLYEVHVPRVVLELAGLLARRKGVFRVTRKGERLLGEEAAGRLYAALVTAFFTKLNLGYLDRFDNDSFQWTVGFALWLLGQIGDRWATVEALEPGLIHPLIREDLAPRASWSPAHMVLECRLLEPLVGFGLLERREIPQEEAWRHECEYRKSPLFDRVLAFDLGPA